MTPAPCSYAHAKRLVSVVLRGRSDPELEAAAWDGLHRAIVRYDHDVTSFDAWAIYVMRASLKNQYRAWRTRRHQTGATGDVAETVEWHPAPRDPALASAVSRAVAALPERQATAVRLCLVEGRSHADAAEVLGVGPPAVTGLMQRALFRLRRSLGALEKS